uniref:uncharacterized protein LOC120348139 n=1 Tax=Styela clava TaxID=7725 RepID=UPI001939A27A|nr:uncharacterized protein LOC120348139 [Styela clava]
MAEGGRQPPVINVQLPAITVNYQEGTIVSGDNVRKKTDVRAAEIGQIVVPTSGNSQAEATELQHDSIPTVFKDFEEENAKRSGSDRGSNDQTSTHPSPHDVTDDPGSSDVTDILGSVNLTEGMHFVTSENIRRLIHQSKFADALITSQDISTSQEQQFMMSECYCQLGRPDKALRCIEALQRIMTSSPKPSVDDVIKLVDNYISDLSHIRALILLSCCAKLYKYNSNPNNSVGGICDCSLKCCNVIKAMVNKGDKMKVIARDVGLKIITDMLRELRSVSGADKNKKADMEAACLKNIGYCYDEVGKYKEAIGFYNKGLDLMNRTFGSNAAKYRMFGELLHNIGYAHYNLSDYSGAESFYLQSLNAHEKVADWPSDKEKQKMTEGTKNNLKITRYKMRNDK